MSRMSEEQKAQYWAWIRGRVKTLPAELHLSKPTKKLLWRMAREEADMMRWQRKQEKRKRARGYVLTG